MDHQRAETIRELMTYLPPDRLWALTGRTELPEHASGTVLFADISGFTSLTEALAQALGPRHGAEELALRLNLVYDPLIAAVDQYGGSIIGFSGDAITCWFERDAGPRATACALAMQAAMRTLATIVLPGGDSVSLTLKAAIAGGAVRRFRVGDPAIQVFDVLVGAPLDHVATAEQLATPGEVVLDAQVRAHLAGDIVVLEQRADPATQQLVHVVGDLRSRPIPSPMPPVDPARLEMDQLRPWILPPVYERLAAGLGTFLTELRPATSLFLRFSGIDFDVDEAAGEQLDAYTGWVQRTIGHYGGHLLDVTIGDKGSYLSAAFGAPIAHHDDTERAALAAFALRALPAELDFVRSVQLGIGRGLMYGGATGGTTRRAYCLRGDEVNLAARLMQAAAPGEILLSQAAHEAISDEFAWESLPAVMLKGKAAAASVFRLLSRREQRGLRLREPHSRLPLVGRETELALIEQQFVRTLGGNGQLVTLSAEAGMGKSRLVSEVIGLAAERQITIAVGECQAYGGRSSYQVWTPIWSTLFELEAAAPLEVHIQRLEHQLGQVEQRLIPRLPLLGAVLNLPIPETELTASLDAELRKASLEALLVDCLQARARQGPLLIVLEDCHWIDPLSQDLLETIARTIVDLPVLMVTTERPLEAEHTRSTQFSRPRHRTEVSLAQLPQQDARHLVELKLKQVTGVDTLAVPGVVEQILARAEGNPFYIEELVQYLGTQNVNLQDPRAVAQLELPTSLHSLILGRIDQLTERQKMTLKVASVVGRVFRVSWLWGVHPQLGERPGVQADLEQLSRLDLTPIEQVEPELTYLFKHIITRDVVYESMPTVMRTLFHGQLGGFIEEQYTDTLTQVVDLLAYHYDLSDNTTKRREYLRKAGDAAKSAYANQSAVDYYQRLLPLLSPAEQSDVMRELGEVWQFVGKWREAEDMYRSALALAERAGNRRSRARCQASLGQLLSNTQSYDEALGFLTEAKIELEQVGDQLGVCRVLEHMSFAYQEQGQYTQALGCSAQQLQIATGIGDDQGICMAVQYMGTVHFRHSNYQLAGSHLHRALDVAIQCGYRQGAVLAGNNLAGVYWEQGDYLHAVTFLRQALDIAIDIGYLHQTALMIGNAGLIYMQQGNYVHALQCYARGLYLSARLGDRRSILFQLGNIADTFMVQRRYDEAERLYTQALELAQTLNIPFALCEAMYGKAELFTSQYRLVEAQYINQEVLDLAKQLGPKDIVFKAQVLSIRLRLTLNQADAQTALGELVALLDTWLDDRQQAVVHYEIWRIDATKAKSRLAAANLYRELYGRSSNIEYRQRFEELTGEMLPEPEALPPLPDRVMGTPVELAALLTLVQLDLETSVG